MGKIGNKIKTNDKEKQAYAYYLSRGWTAPQAAAIVGNLLHESGLNTSAEGDIGYKGGSSRGIAQFRGERLNRLKSRYGDNWTDFNNQLEFVDWELNNTHKSAGQALRETKDIYNAGRIVSDRYEIPAVKFKANKDRQSKVFNTYNKFSGLTEDLSKYTQGYTSDAPINNTPSNIISLVDTPNFIPSEEITNNDTPSIKEDTQEEIAAKENINKVSTEQQLLQDYFSSTQPQVAEEVQQSPTQEVEQFPTLLDQYNQVSQLVDNPIAQEGGIQESKDFIQNWYKNRVLPDPNLNSTYQAERDLYINQSRNLPEPNYVDQLDDFNTQGTYDINTNRVDLLKSANPLVYTHEIGHKINLPLKDTQSNVNAFSIIGQNILPQDRIQNQWVKDNYKQISNYQEVIPRLNSYRQLHGLKPDQVITPELIQQNREMYQTGQIPFEDNTDQLYKLFENEGLSNVLNKVVSNDSSNNYYAQQGGQIPVSSNGVYDYPMQEVIVPTQNGNITMSNVNYSILGIDEYGNQKMMMPGQEYKFPGKTIYEIPQLKNYFNKI